MSRRFSNARARQTASSVPPHSGRDDPLLTPEAAPQASRLNVSDVAIQSNTSTSQSRSSPGRAGSATSTSRAPCLFDLIPEPSETCSASASPGATCGRDAATDECSLPEEPEDALAGVGTARSGCAAAGATGGAAASDVARSGFAATGAAAAGLLCSGGGDAGVGTCAAGDGGSGDGGGGVCSDGLLGGEGAAGSCCSASHWSRRPYLRQKRHGASAIASAAAARAAHVHSSGGLWVAAAQERRRTLPAQRLWDVRILQKRAQHCARGAARAPVTTAPREQA